MGREDRTARSVMIIDDDLGFAESLAEMLKHKGYRARCVDAPKRALAVLRELSDSDAPIRVALIDVPLPGGIDLIRRLRAEQQELVSVLMEREVLGPIANEKYRSYVGDIRESGMHLLHIINDILDLSKAEAGKLELHEEVFDLSDTIRAVRQLIGTRIGDGGLSASVELQAGLPRLRADERKTKQLLINLVSNAIKFTPPGGHIEIASRFEPETGMILTVSDTGIGIAPENLARVFEPFEQVDNPFIRSRQGTGLGLPLVKAIIERRGGTIAVD